MSYNRKLTIKVNTILSEEEADDLLAEVADLILSIDEEAVVDTDNEEHGRSSDDEDEEEDLDE